MKKAEISGIILTKNEGKNLKRVIKSLAFCQEILVVDDQSTDDTPIVAKDLGAKVISHKLEKNFASQRNFALSKSSYQWVFFLDADEVIPESLAKEIVEKIASGNADGFKIQRQDFFCGKLLRFGETGNVSFLRLARKDKGQWEGLVHEEWEINGMTSYLENPLEHYPHPTVSSFLTKINWYTDLLVLEWKKDGKNVSGWQILFYPGGKFISNYFFKLGFLDGVPGFIMAMMMSFHSFLARAKFWLSLHPTYNHA